MAKKLEASLPFELTGAQKRAFKEVVEDLILAAVKDAQAKAADRAQEEMSKLTEGLGLPADMKLPF